MGKEITKDWLKPQGSSYQKKIAIFNEIKSLVDKDATTNEIATYLHLHFNFSEILDLLVQLLKNDLKEEIETPKIRITIEQKEMIDNFFKVIKKR